MADHTTAPPPQQEAERRLLDLHGRLWGLTTELLLPPTERGDEQTPHRPSPPRPPRAIILVSSG